MPKPSATSLFPDYLMKKKSFFNKKKNQPNVMINAFFLDDFIMSKRYDMFYNLIVRFHFEAFEL